MKKQVHKTGVHLNQPYYQLPRSFFVNPKYQSLSMLAKVTWSAMWSRAKMSEKNGWTSESGRVYFFYSYKDMMKDLGIRSTATIYKVKQELVGFGLLEELRIDGRKSLYTLNIPETHETKEDALQLILKDTYHRLDKNKNSANRNAQQAVFSIPNYSKKIYDLLMRILPQKEYCNLVYQSLLEAHRYLEEKYACTIPLSDEAFTIRQAIGYTAIRYKSAAPSPLDVASYKDYWYQSFVTELENQGIDKFTKKDESSRQKQ